MPKSILQALVVALCVLFAPLGQAAVVNINKADAAALTENLNGIGPKKAAAIVAYRKSNGDYKSVEELLNVKGIGEKLLKRNLADLSLSSGETQATSAVSKVEDAHEGSAEAAAVVNEQAVDSKTE